MEIKLNQGDKFTIPDGCKAVVENGIIVIENEDAPLYKDGDILSLNSGSIIIFKGFMKGDANDYYAGRRNWGGIAFKDGVNNHFGRKSSIKGYATKEEKELLFSALKDAGKFWDASKKKMVDLYKNGDIIHCEYTDRGLTAEWLSIVHTCNGMYEYEYHVMMAIHSNYGREVPYLKFNNHQDVPCNIRPATEEDKQKFFEELAKEGYKWNAEEKKIVKCIPRAKIGERYYFVSSSLAVAKDTELNAALDNPRYESGNYFITREDAEKICEKIKEIFQNRTLND